MGTTDFTNTKFHSRDVNGLDCYNLVLLLVEAVKNVIMILMTSISEDYHPSHR